jgi:dTDP-4-dehydrorhamnose 3,5-epimerase
MQDKRHVPPRLPPARLDEVEGFASASPMQSLMTAAGALRLDPIDGVRYRPARPVSHHHGHLTEVFRADWGLTEAPIAQINLITTFPGHIRGWGIHRSTVDRLFAATGSLCIVCYDGRRESPTFGCVNEFMLGERNQGLIVIPPGSITVGRTSARMRRRSSACPASSTTTMAPIAGSCRGTPRPPEESYRISGHSCRLNPPHA